MDAAFILEIGVGVLLACREGEQFLVAVVIDAFEYPRKAIAILAIVATDREEMPTGRMEALAQAIIALQTEVGGVALGALTLGARTDADAEIFEQDLRDGARH